MIKAGCLCVALCAALAPHAQAQSTWTEKNKGFINVSGGVQIGSHTLETNSTFTIYDEEGSVATSQKVKSGGLFDLSGGYRVYNDVLVVVGYSWTSSKADATVNASVPDPVVFDRPRAVSTTATGLKHTENVVNLSAAWIVPVTHKVDVAISAGPTIFMVNQDVPTSVTVAEPGPTITDVGVSSESKTTVGINLGIDIAYMVNDRYGVGGLARYTWGSVDMPGATDKLTVGGFQIGGGLRVRF